MLTYFTVTIEQTISVNVSVTAMSFDEVGPAFDDEDLDDWLVGEFPFSKPEVFVRATNLDPCKAEYAVVNGKVVDARHGLPELTRFSQAADAEVRARAEWDAHPKLELA